MKKLVPSPLITLLIAVSGLAASVNANPSSPPGSPKLSEDGPGGISLTPPTNGPTQKATTPNAANLAARTPAKPPTRAIADGRRYSNHCQLEDTAPSVSFRVPMATRWWWANQTQQDVKFCVVAGAISSAKSAWVLPISYSLTVMSPGNLVVPMNVGSGAATLMVGGAFVPSTTLWAMFGPGVRMGSNEFCTSGTVKHSELSGLQLKLLHANGVGACGIRFADMPWADARLQSGTKGIPVQKQ